MLTAPAPYGVTAAFYDHRNLPLLLTANGVMSAYRYDEQGQRISKRVAGGLSSSLRTRGRRPVIVPFDGVSRAGVPYPFQCPPRYPVAGGRGLPLPGVGLPPRERCTLACRLEAWRGSARGDRHLSQTLQDDRFPVRELGNQGQLSPERGHVLL